MEIGAWAIVGRRVNPDGTRDLEPLAGGTDLPRMTDTWERKDLGANFPTLFLAVRPDGAGWTLSRVRQQNEGHDVSVLSDDGASDMAELSMHGVGNDDWGGLFKTLDELVNKKEDPTNGN